MSSPVLHILAGPNGAGKSTFVREVLQPVTRLPFINADEIAAERWPGSEAEHAYHASDAASEARNKSLNQRSSFITETVFSHPSKIDLVRRATQMGYLVFLHVILVPENLAVLRVEYRVSDGGHTVPESKIRERYRRLWSLISTASDLADRATFYDNSRAHVPFRVIANYQDGQPSGDVEWPAWTPAALISSR